MEVFDQSASTVEVDGCRRCPDFSFDIIVSGDCCRQTSLSSGCVALTDGCIVFYNRAQSRCMKISEFNLRHKVDSTHTYAARPQARDYVPSGVLRN